MSGRSIDHIVLAVRSLDQTAAAYQRLGFTLTPRASHEARMGTSNRLAQFAERSFMELLEVDRPAGIMPHRPEETPPVYSFGARNRAALAAREGISFLVFASEDARADLAGFKAAGQAAYAPFDFTRQAKAPDGTAAEVSFSLGFAVSPDMPGAPVFVCQNRAASFFWKAEFQEHDNGAKGMRAVWLATPAPERDAAFFASLFGGEARAADGGLDVSCGEVQTLRLRPPEAVAAVDRAFAPGALASPRFVGIELAGPGAVTIPSDEGAGMFVKWVAP
ncbi:MAG: VOC family protein [Paracoccaceae bacterium]